MIKKKHQVPWKIPIKRENIDIFYAAPQWQVTHYPIWGEISGVLRSPVVYVATEEHWVTRSLKRPKKTSSGLISHVYVSKSSIFWGITWFFISNFNDQSEWVREMMLVWRRSANKTRTHCYWISSVDEGVLRFFSQLWVVFHSRAWSEIPPQCINLPTESTMGCSSISIANSPMYNDML